PPPFKVAPSGHQRETVNGAVTAAGAHDWVLGIGAAQLFERDARAAAALVLTGDPVVAAVYRPRKADSGSPGGCVVFQAAGPVQTRGGWAVQLTLSVRAGERVVVVLLGLAGIGLVIGNARFVGQVIFDGRIGAVRTLRQQVAQAHRHHPPDAIVPRPA